MKSVLAVVLLLIFVVSWPGKTVFAVPFNADRIAQIWRISGPSNSCGTAIALGHNKLLTTAHLASSLCPAGKCQGLVVEQASRIGEPPLKSKSIDSAEVALLLEFVDIAILEISAQQELALAPIAFGELPLRDRKVFSLSFSNCGPLHAHTGVVLRESGPWIETNLQIRHGASGAPIFSEQGELVGVITEGGSIASTLSALALGNSFSARGIQIPKVFATAPEDPERLVKYYLEQLLRYYESEVAPQGGFARNWLGMKYHALVRSLAKDLRRLNVQQSYPILVQLGSKVDELDFSFLEGSSSSKFLYQIASAILSANLERSGYRGANFRIFSPEDTMKMLSDQRPGENLNRDLGRVLHSYGKRKSPGFYIELTKLSAIIAVLCVVLLGCWGFSLGYVFRETRGMRPLSRSLIVIFCALFAWPLSLLIYRKWSQSRATTNQGLGLMLFF